MAAVEERTRSRSPVREQNEEQVEKYPWNNLDSISTWKLYKKGVSVHALPFINIVGATATDTVVMFGDVAMNADTMMEVAFGIDPKKMTRGGQEMPAFLRSDEITDKKESLDICLAVKDEAMLNYFKRVDEHHREGEGKRRTYLSNFEARPDRLRNSHEI